MSSAAGAAGWSGWHGTGRVLRWRGSWRAPFGGGSGTVASLTDSTLGVNGMHESSHCSKTMIHKPTLKLLSLFTNFSRMSQRPSRVKETEYSQDGLKHIFVVRSERLIAQLFTKQELNRKK